MHGVPTAGLATPRQAVVQPHRSPKAPVLKTPHDMLLHMDRSSLVLKVSATIHWLPWVPRGTTWMGTASLNTCTCYDRLGLTYG